MSDNIIILGGGGHAISLIEVIEDQGIFKIEGILDDNLPLGSNVLDYPAIGNLADMSEYFTRQRGFVIAIGHTKDNTLRSKIFNQLVLWKQNIPNIVSPKARVSHRAKLDIGSQIMSGVYIGPNAKIGKNTIINTNAVIEHGSEVGDNCHIGPSVTVVGDKIIYDNIFICAGGVVTKHLQTPGIYKGIPAKIL